MKRGFSVFFRRVSRTLSCFSFCRLFSGSSFPDKIDTLICGLGNIGQEYKSTRHNFGFRVADAFCKKLEHYGSGRFGGAEYVWGKLSEKYVVMVIKPTTFMNRSGSAIDRYCTRLDLDMSRVLVVVDDYNITLGTLRIRKNGSDGGHNGLKSIIAVRGPDFPRLRCGIGPLPDKMATIDFVLGEFTSEQEKKVQEVIFRTVDAISLFISQGVDPVMNKFNN